MADTPAASPAPGPAPFTVIVPAHDEEATVGRTLRALAADGAGLPRVLVICNACTDRTAEMARAALPQAEIVEIGEGGKWRALNEGLARAGSGSVIVVDADVEISAAALTALARVLANGTAWAASPSVEFDLAGADGWVRAYYRVFARHPYMHEGIGGCGVYGLSADGRAALGTFPPLISDDGYARARLPGERQQRVRMATDGAPVASRVRPPRTLLELVRAEARWRRGDRELVPLVDRVPHRRRFLWEMFRAGKVARADIIAFCAIKLAGRMLALIEPLHPERHWRKDETSRS